MNDLNWMKIDLPSLQSIENIEGGSFIDICSIILEGIYLWNELIWYRYSKCARSNIEWMEGP